MIQEANPNVFSLKCLPVVGFTNQLCWGAVINKVKFSVFYLSCKEAQLWGKTLQAGIYDCCKPFLDKN